MVKHGDTVLNIHGRMLVTFEGYVAGRVSSYRIQYGNGFEEFTGTMEELLQHCTDKVKTHNKHVEKFGGELI